MDVEEPAERLRELLRDVGFNRARPEPLVVWEAFKRFVVEPFAIETVEVWFEAGNADQDSGAPAYFDFVRMFRSDDEEVAELLEQITAHFTAPPGVDLELGSGVVITGDVDDLDQWFRAVESSPSFRAGCDYSEWLFEVRID